MHWSRLLTIALLVAASCRPLTSRRAEAADRQQDEVAIRAAAKGYLAALARGDSKTLNELWMPDGNLVDEFGRSHSAREVIAQEATAKGGPLPELKMTGGSIRFLTGDVAIEDGTSEIRHPTNRELPALQGRFTAIWQKSNGKWRLASVREARAEPPAATATLKDLDSLVGEWSSDNKESAMEVSARWNANRTFLIRELKVSRAQQVSFAATQWIGWDPVSRKIRSWTFDADGGYGEGVWTKRGDSWVIDAIGVLPDGVRTSSTNEYTLAGNDQLNWRSTKARNNGEPVTDLEIKLRRKSTTSAN